MSIPFPVLSQSDDQPWEQAQTIVEALKAFDQNAGNAISLTDVCLASLTLIHADILSFLCRQCFQDEEPSPVGFTGNDEVEEMTGDDNVAVEIEEQAVSQGGHRRAENEWHEIDRIVKRRNYRS